MTYMDLKNFCAELEINIAKDIQAAERELCKRKFIDSPEALGWVTDATDAAVKAALSAVEKALEG